MKKKILDLYSGLGGFSEAFMNDEDYEVMRLEINPMLSNVPNTEIIDCKKFLRELRQLKSDGYEHERPYAVLAAPPCTEFSLGYNSPRSKAARGGYLEEYEPDMSHLMTILEIIKLLNPRYFVFENVGGACPYFEPILGRHKWTNRSCYLWGKFPAIGSIQVNKESKISVGSGVMQHNIRSLIPIEISQGIKAAFESQMTLLDY